MKRHAVIAILIIALGLVVYKNVQLSNTLYHCSRAVDSLERETKDLAEFIGFIRDALPNFCSVPEGEVEEMEFEIEF